MTSFHNSLTKMLGIRHPIFLAPMAFVSGGKLAGTVSAAGGLGLLGETYKDEAYLRSEYELAIQTYREHLGSKAEDPAPLGVGFIMFGSIEKRPELLDAALSYKPKVVQLAFGEFKQNYFEKIHAAGSLVCCQIQTVKEAIEVAKKGADIIVCQGYESGGHGAPHASTIFVFIPEVIQELNRAGYGHIPVVAAGGICTGTQLLASLTLGASGVTLGTRFMCSDEFLQTPMAKRSVDAALHLNDGGVTTIRTRIYDQLGTFGWPSNYDARVACNTLTTEASKLPCDAPAEDSKARTELLKLSETNNVCYVGGGVGLIKRSLPAKEIIDNIVQEAQEAQNLMKFSRL